MRLDVAIRRLGRTCACMLAASLAGAAPALAVPDDVDGGAPVGCGPIFYRLSVQFALLGLPVAGSTVEVDARNAKLVSEGLEPGCFERYARIPSFRWTLEAAPAGQAATLVDGRTFAPGVRVQGPGVYRVRLTACPNGCRITAFGGTFDVRPSSRDVTIEVQETIVVPPATIPERPLGGPVTSPTPWPESIRNKKCSVGPLGGGGVKDPQWVTTQPFSGADDYRRLDGQVLRSWISSEDNFLNHDSQDHNFAVLPDPPYLFLLSTSPEFADSRLLGVEWEGEHFPVFARPTPGDRVGLYGFSIFDCGHPPYYTEIHPPVGIATQRPRVVHIPESFATPELPRGAGRGVYAPGIVTDLWFDRRSGETTRNCSATGLHQPAGPGGRGSCIREPHPVRRTFRFEVHLPRNPQVMLQEMGVAAPPVPLYVAVSRPSSGPGGSGPDPVITRQDRDGTTWLQVDVNLRGLRDTQYARRISAAWVYPSPDNWGARRWRVGLTAMDVEDDAEPAFDDGDWRVFFNTNNGEREWTQVLKCDGCVDDDERQNLGHRTGDGLGRDPVLLPGQRVVVHMVGYDDETKGDDIGTVDELVSQEEAQAACDRDANPCRHRTASHGGAGEYTLEYTIGPGQPGLAPPALTPEARALYDAYVIGGDRPVGCRLLRPDICAILPPPGEVLAEPWHPDDFVLAKATLSRRLLPVTDVAEGERWVLTGISTRQLRRVLDRLRTRNPKGYRRLLGDLRDEVGDVPRAMRRDLFPLIHALRHALPQGDLPRALPRGFRPELIRPFPLHAPDDGELSRGR